jgi:hypothetical protein
MDEPLSSEQKLPHRPMGQIGPYELALSGKISGLGWFCVHDEDQWIALFKLTDAQLKEVKDWKESA